MAHRREENLVFAAESAQLGDAHSNFGVFPGAGGAAILPRRIGLNRAKYLLFSGENVSAREMMDWGLVNKVVPDADLRNAVQVFTDKLSDKSPAVLRRMKADVAQYLPEKTEHVLFCNLTAFQRDTYERFLDSGVVVRLM